MKEPLLFIVRTQTRQCAVCHVSVEQDNDYCHGCGLHVCVPCVFAPPKETWGPHVSHEHFKPRSTVPASGPN